MSHEEKLEGYAKGDQLEPLSFPASLSGPERAKIHGLAQSMGLRAISEGNKEDGTRFITVRCRTEKEIQKDKERAERQDKASKVQHVQKHEQDLNVGQDEQSLEEYEEDDEWADERAREFDMYKALHITQDGDRIAGGEVPSIHDHNPPNIHTQARIRSAYHKLSLQVPTTHTA